MSRALPGAHYCVNHQGNHSHYAPHNCELCVALAEVEALRAANIRLQEALAADPLDQSMANEKLLEQVAEARAEVEALRALLRKAGDAIHYHRREQGYDKSQLESEIEDMLAKKERT